MAETITLNTPEALAPPTASSIEWNSIKVDLNEEIIRANFTWRNETSVIPVGGTIEQTQIVRNIPDNPDTPGNEQDNQYTKSWEYEIRAEDVGKKIGKVLLRKVFNQFKDRILTAGNTGTIAD